MECSDCAGPGLRGVLARVAALLLVVAATGCQGREEVKSYTVPKEPAGPGPGAAAGEYRILGAIFPADAPAWFFKLQGTAAQVAAAEPLFEQVVKSVRFPMGLDQPPEFDVPEGARRGGGRMVAGIRIHDTIQFGPDGPEATVTASGGDLLMNVNRWAGQVGHPTLTPASLSANTTLFPANNVEGRRVDLRGPRNPATRGMGGPFMKN